MSVAAFPATAQRLLSSGDGLASICRLAQQLASDCDTQDLFRLRAALASISTIARRQAQETAEVDALITVLTERILVNVGNEARQAQSEYIWRLADEILVILAASEGTSFQELSDALNADLTEVCQALSVLEAAGHECGRLWSNPK